MAYALHHDHLWEFLALKVLGNGPLLKISHRLSHRVDSQSTHVKLDYICMLETNIVSLISTKLL